MIFFYSMKIKKSEQKKTQAVVLFCFFCFHLQWSGVLEFLNFLIILNNFNNKALLWLPKKNK